ncbi:MAG TPA: peptidoglycan DD-metalloendopeptidase family protein [Solirubrobacterales bacterium]|jgi:murein DD-endopeptidase MepM/ murein hydrolase activator NlpD|nr:peptidoglycan DD-metalloendopeptidase family protein [Solirubrobacterales bacterium]
MLKIRPFAVALVAAAAALVVLLACSAAAPANDLQSKLEGREAKLSEVREKRGVLTTTISRYKARIERLTDEVAALRTQEAAVRERLEAKQAELDRAVAELDVAKKHLAVVKARLKRALVALRERLVAMYEAGTPDLLSVIVDAHGYEELVNRTEYLSRINGLDEAVVGRVRDLRNQVKRTVARLRSAKNRIEAARDAIAAEEQALESARAAVQSRQADLVAVRRSREAALGKIEDSEQELDGEVASIQAELAATLAGTGSAPLPAGPIRYGSGQLIWPVDGPVVSGFGMRWGRMHEGIDIAVPAGTPIRAAAAGSVVLVQSEAESGGYGNFTCLDHGGGLQTCYAHQSSVAVSSGQSVSQGDVIGYVGCTGHCFGDHLHFEVRINGAPTDPLGYL